MHGPKGRLGRNNVGRHSCTTGWGTSGIISCCHCCAGICCICAIATELVEANSRCGYVVAQAAVVLGAALWTQDRGLGAG
jgi:hypothetical protein